MKNQTQFKAMVVSKSGDNSYIREIVERNVADLPPGELLIRVHYSSLNYKDALSATGHPGVTRHFPHTPGIDAAGEVVSCTDDSFAPGDKVLVTGYDLGMETDGGFGQYIRIPSLWAVRMPTGLTLRESMALGTAGFTAALSILKLQQLGIKPENGDLLVTGATGGVGSIAVSILAKLGFRVVAVTGKQAEHPFLLNLGAAAVISRAEINEGSERAMLKERWAGAVDVVGGATLATVLKSTRYGGVVTCCGLVDSAELPLNVYPFILRGVSLVGIDSVNCQRTVREEVWQRLAADWKPARLDNFVIECNLNELEDKIQMVIASNIIGRVVVRLL